MLSTRRKFALVGLPLVLALITGAAIVLVTVSYGDSLHRWTADAAILTAAGLLTALVGLPIALFQLFAVERDLARLALIPVRHFGQLHAALERSIQTLYQQIKLDFNDPPDGRQLYREMFFAHFPELSDDFVDWDQAVERVQSARVSFAQELERVADRLGVDAETYDRPAMLQALQDVARPSLHLKLEEWRGDTVPVSGSVDGSVDVAGIRTNISTSRTLTEPELRLLVHPLIDLCAEARNLPDVQNIAHAQDALTAKIQPLADGLKLYLARETIPVAANCPICQVNVGR